jgi:uncharacterized membrane protein
MGVIVETKKRHLLKTISWRVLATTNSFLVLSMDYESNLFNAVFMNITGMLVMFYFERIWSKIDYGRYIEEV